MLKNNWRDDELQAYADTFVKLNTGKEVEIVVLMPTPTAIKMQEELLQVSLGGSLEVKRISYLDGETMYCAFSGVAGHLDVDFIVATIAEYAPRATVMFNTSDRTKSVTVA